VELETVAGQNIVGDLMMKIIDLSMPIEDHLRWPVDRQLAKDFARGDQFQITWVGWGVHGFTHMDSPRHMLPDGSTTSDIPLEATVGDCAIFDLSNVADNTAIDAKKLAQADPGVQTGDIVVLKAEWDTRYSYQTPEFWTQSPYLTRDAAEWLRAKEIKTVGFDFPQDYVIRLLLDGEVAPLEEFVTHDVLLRNGVVLIEYLCNTAEIKSSRVQLYALPLKIPNSDGAPARIIAIEGT
jgi:kynurenine formamidase